jgi:hypothetical protein
MKKLLGVLALLIVQTTCLSRSKTEDELAKRVADLESKLTALQSHQNTDIWQRCKDCVEQTEKFAKNAGWVEGKSYQSHSIVGWGNHYSEKYGRCFIQINYLNNGNLKYLPTTFYEVFDAFESRLLGGCSEDLDVKASNACYIQEDEASAAATSKDGFEHQRRVNAYFKDRMNK